MTEETEYMIDEIEEMNIQASADELENERSEMLVAQNIQHNANHASILKLPREILLYILKWVVSDIMDVADLGSWSLVCKDFYHLSQESLFWRSLCQKVWGKKVILRPYPSWQSMYMIKPHVFCHGVYISRTTYMRSGDNTMTLVYRPYHMVEYFRMLRFLPNGEVMMLTTPQDPRESVYKLQAKSRKVHGLLVGRYFVLDEKPGKNSMMAVVTAILKPYHVGKQVTTCNSGNQSPTPMSEYQLELEMTSTSSRKRFNKLTWIHHSLSRKYPGMDSANTCEFDVSRQYPPLYFNRVKSFTAVANKPL